MKRAITLLVAAAMGLTVARLSAQAPSSALPTVDQVLEKYITAIGGRDAMEKVTSRVSTGTFEIPDMGASGTITISEKAPNKSLAVIELGGMGTMREGSDGVAAWEDQGGNIHDKAGAELADALRSSTFNSELKFKSLYKTVVVTGKEAIEGRDTYVVLATPAEGAPNKLYFDASSGLMVKQSSTRDTAQGPMDVDVTISDYRAVGGVKLPFTVRQATAMFTVVIKLSDIKVNVPIDDAIFKRPGF
jgi:outer membrane lipoprotein-sorting protein